MMNTNELKQAITEDLNRLKHLEIDVIPAKTYYTDLFKLAVNAFWKIGLVLFIAMLYVFLTDEHPRAQMPGFYWEQTRDALLATVMMSTAVLIVLLPSLIHYYLIQYHLQHRLKTGALLVKKLQCCAWLFWGVFVLFAILFASYAEIATIFFLLGFALIGSALVTYFVMSLEFNRVGLSILFTVIRRWFNGDKT
ncbi:hypothetical protein [Legionella jordanis]|uniref:hypothetical protein n=1 Tax=Legionella jordanis TaxID=456 RepID=UPI000EFABE19|nr:hypothetical protein [Legionella jordanis]RMW99883.1 hypothetical protein EAW55_13255 [Legionella jordanis]